MDKQIRLLIVDDHQLVRSGLISVLNTEPDLLVVAEASSGHEAIEIYPHCLPDITLIDFRLPGLDGPETIAAILRQFPSGRFIILSSFGRETDIYRAIQAGASGYVLKDMSNNEVVNAVRMVHRGLRYFPTRVIERLSSRPLQSALTNRELEVLTLLVHGKSNREIADTLGIAEGTVRWFLTIIYGKLEVRGRTQAVATALQKGLVNSRNAAAVSSQ